MRRKIGSLSTGFAEKVHNVFTEEIGRKNENLAFDIVTKSVRDVLKSKGIIYLVDYTFWQTRGGDLKIEFIEPIKFVLFVEIKSSRREAEKHRQKRKHNQVYKNPVVVVNSRRSKTKMINRFVNIFQEEIRKKKALIK